MTSYQVTLLTSRPYPTSIRPPLHLTQSALCIEDYYSATRGDEWANDQTGVRDKHNTYAGRVSF